MARPLDAFRRCAISSSCIWRNHPSPSPPYLPSQTHLISRASFLSGEVHALEENSTIITSSSSSSSSSSRCRTWWQGIISMSAKACNVNNKQSLTISACSRGTHYTQLSCCAHQLWERVDADAAIDPPTQKAKARPAAAAGSRWKLLLRKLRARMQSSCIANYPQECPLNHEFSYDPVSYALNFDDGVYRVPHLSPCSYASLVKQPSSLSFLS